MISLTILDGYLRKFEKVHEKSTVREHFAKNMEIHVLSGSERCEMVIEHRREKNVILKLCKKSPKN